MLFGCVLVICLCVFVAPCVCVRFSNVFGSHMVLQRDAEVLLWGFVEPGESNVGVTLGSSARVSAEINTTALLWSVSLPPQPLNFIGVAITVTATNQTKQTNTDVLEDVLFGDVLLCSGQSNVDVPVQYANENDPDAETQEEAIANQIGVWVRLRIVPNQCSGCVPAPSPQYEFWNCSRCGSSDTQCNSLPWVLANATTVRSFSATCWFSGRHLNDMLDSTVPLGLVRSSWGGTQIQWWSPPDAISACTKFSTKNANQQTEIQPPLTLDNSELWNAMWFPLLGLNYKMVVWYQGESNVGAPTNEFTESYYSCALPTLISAFRTTQKQRFNLLSSSSSVNETPFIVVQLAAYCLGATFCDETSASFVQPDVLLPWMRLSQNEGVDQVNNTWIVTAVDLGTLHPSLGSIHPTNKDALGQRIAATTIDVAYKNGTSVTNQSPRVSSAIASTEAPNTISVGFSANSAGLSVKDSQQCPSVIQPVYCPVGPFEVQISLATNSSSLSSKSALSCVLRTVPGASLAGCTAPYNCTNIPTFLQAWELCTRAPNNSCGGITQVSTRGYQLRTGTSLARDATATSWQIQIQGPNVQGCSFSGLVGVWTPAESVQLSSVSHSVVDVTVGSVARQLLRESASPIDILRVRYGFADWPVGAVWDIETGLPALPFDVEVVGRRRGAAVAEA